MNLVPSPEDGFALPRPAMSPNPHQQGLRHPQGLEHRALRTQCLALCVQCLAQSEALQLLLP